MNISNGKSSQREQLFRQKRDWSTQFDLAQSPWAYPVRDKDENQSAKTFEQMIYPIDAASWCGGGWQASPLVREESLKSEELEVKEETKEEVKKEIKEEERDFSMSEKVKALRSLREFAEDKVEGQDSQGDVQKVRFKGGEIHLVDRPAGHIHHASEQLANVEVFDDLAELTLKAPIRVAFLGDVRPSDNGKEDILAKIIEAMGLRSGEFARGPIPADRSKFQNEMEGVSQERQRELAQQVISRELLQLRPKVLITLGAKSTHLILDKKERLNQVHGKFYDLGIKESEQVDSPSLELKVVPIFHPDLLRINLNMKRAAWTDLQKVMQYLSS